MTAIDIGQTGPTSHRFISQRMRLHYADWGNSGAPPLLLVHGGRDHARSWDWVAQELRHDWHIIAIDHRGHGDSDWATDGNYAMMDYVYDLSQLIHQLDLAPVTIVSHSMGGMISTRYAGLFPDRVRKLVAIEGLGLPAEMMAKWQAIPFPDRIRDWMDKKRQAAGRSPRRYATLEDAYTRMKEENAYLTDAQAKHLTLHGANRNEDGSWSWKFDPHLNFWPPFDMAKEQVEELWQAITCPTLLLHGADSWVSHPAKDGTAQHFRNATIVEIERAGHWLHHDQLGRFMQLLRDFL